MSARPNSAGNAKKAIETFGELCNRVELALEVKIPEYLKKILMYTGFDSGVTLRCMRDMDIDSLEKFARSEVYLKCAGISPSGWSNDFYGDLSRYTNYKDFTIPPGHRRLLIAIAAYLRGDLKIGKTLQK